MTDEFCVPLVGYIIEMRCVVAKSWPRLRSLCQAAVHTGLSHSYITTQHIAAECDYAF